MKGTIQTIAFGGSGILHHEGLVVFVPYTAPGDVATVELTEKKKRHAFAKVLKIEKPSSLRIEPSCPLFGRCGGCQLQHLNYAAQLEMKRKFIQETLERIGQIHFSVPPVEPASLQWEYRRHIRLNLRALEAGGFEAGFMDNDSAFLRLQTCPLFEKEEEGILSAIQSLLKTLDNRGIQEASLRIFKNPQEKPLLAFSSFPTIPSNWADVNRDNWTGIAFKAPGREEKVGEVAPFIEVEGMKMYYSPYGFLQNHSEQSSKLYRAILAWIPQSADRILDLYCGIGITSHLLAQQGKEVLGIESNPESIRLAKINAPGARFIKAKVEGVLQPILQSFAPDAILLNPPREGLNPSILDQIEASQTETLIYTSCMPATLARDLKQLRSYSLEKVLGFDMFPQTTHVETLVLLRKKKAMEHRSPIAF